MEHEDNTNTQFEQNLQNANNYINMEHPNLQQMNMASSSSVDAIHDASGSKYDEDFNTGDDDESKYAKELQQSEKHHDYKHDNDGYCYGDDFADREAHAFASNPYHRISNYNANFNRKAGFGFGEDNLNGVDDADYIASRQLDTPSVDEEEISKNGTSSSMGVHVHDVQQPFVVENNTNDNTTNNVDDSSIASNVTAQIDYAVPQVDVLIEKTHNSEQHNQQELEFIIDQDETSSLADNTTNGTSSMSENVPPSSNDVYPLDMMSDHLNDQKDNEKNSSLFHVEGDNSKCSLLNPEAKEFVPKFGEGSSKPSSPIADDDAVRQMNPFNSSFENNSPSNFRSNALPKHLTEDDDDVVAASPRKGSSISADIDVVPRALSEFAQEANQRPHEVDQFLDEKTHYGSNENLYGQTPNEAKHEVVEFMLETKALIDHGPETCVDAEVEFGDDGNDDIMERSMYLSPDERIQEELNSVQLLPINEFESLNSEELSPTEVLRKEEQLNMEFNLQPHPVFHDIVDENGPKLRDNIVDDTNMQQYQMDNSFSTNLSADECTTKPISNEYVKFLKASNYEQLPYEQPTMELSKDLDFNDSAVQQALSPLSTEEKHLTEETKESQSLSYHMDMDMEQTHSEVVFNSSDDGNLTQKEEDGAYQATTAINIDSNKLSPGNLSVERDLLGSHEKIMTEQLTDDNVASSAMDGYENVSIQSPMNKDRVGDIQQAELSSEIMLDQLSAAEDVGGAGDTQIVKNILVEDTKLEQQIVANDIPKTEIAVVEFSTDVYNDDISKMKGTTECNKEIYNEIGTGDGAPISMFETKDIIQPICEKKIQDNSETYIAKAQLIENEVVTVAGDAKLEPVLKVDATKAAKEIASGVEVVPLPKSECTVLEKKPDVTKKPPSKARTTTVKPKTSVTVGTAKGTAQVNETIKKTTAAATTTLTKTKAATSKIGAADKKPITSSASNVIRRTSATTTSSAKTLTKSSPTNAAPIRASSTTTTTKLSAPKPNISSTIRKVTSSSQGSSTTANKNRPTSTSSSTAPLKATSATTTTSAAAKPKITSPRLTLTSQLRKAMSASNSTANKTSTIASTANTVNAKPTTTTARMKLSTSSSAAPKPLSARPTTTSTTATSNNATRTAAKRVSNTVASSANGLSVKLTTTNRKSSPIKSVSSKTPTKTTDTIVTSSTQAKTRTVTSSKTPNKSPITTSRGSANKPIKKPTKDSANADDNKIKEQIEPVEPMEQINGVIETMKYTTNDAAGSNSSAASLVPNDTQSS